MNNPSIPVQLAVGADFLSAFSQLPQKQQKKVQKFLGDFTANPDASTYNYEHIRSAKDKNLRSVRIDKDYRGILLKPDRGNVHVLLWVDKHDDAYAWAERRTCLVHPATGTMQVILTVAAAAASVGASLQQPSQKGASNALFANYSDGEIISLGVPPTLLSIVREVADEKELDSLEKVLPKESFEGIFLLAAGYTVEECRRELGIESQVGVDTEDFVAAVERAGSKRQFVVITDASEMEKILAAPLAQWRVFLHPSQRRLVEMKAGGPVRVLGSAGTGKTVVAMHRAVWLLRNVCAPGEKVLFTTFTKNLAADIASNLKSLCSLGDCERIEVVHLDAWVKRFLDKQEFRLKLIYEDKKGDRLWEEALGIAGRPLGLEADFLRAEWDNVIQANGIDSFEQYQKVSRVGRSRRLNREERKLLWPLFEGYRASLTELGLSEPADAFRTARNLIEARQVAFPYRCILVDESQDFGNEAFRLIRAIVPEVENDLFLVGDAHQRIYGHQVVLSRCGIDVRGRGRKLRINYRTTEELKNWAMGLLKGLEFDDLDAGFDDNSGVRSLFHGENPMVVPCSNETAAGERVASHVNDLLESGVPKESICVVAPTHRALEGYEKYVQSICPETHQIETGKAEDIGKPGVRLATIHRVKGLEFDHVLLADSFTTRSSPSSDESEKKMRALLYVAATRARKSLLFCTKSAASHPPA
ncbi:MAG: UvrD-helicase domain-containing protein [Terrimicrobiaceae bacterium]